MRTVRANGEAVSALVERVQDRHRHMTIEGISGLTAALPAPFSSVSARVIGRAKAGEPVQADKLSSLVRVLGDLLEEEILESDLMLAEDAAAPVREDPAQGHVHNVQNTSVSGDGAIGGTVAPGGQFIIHAPPKQDG